MAAGAVILITAVLLTIIILHFLDSREHVVFKQVTNSTYVLVGVMLGIIIGAITVTSVIHLYKRKKEDDIRQHGGAIFALASAKSADTSSDVGGNMTACSSNLVPQNSVCPACKCRGEQHTTLEKSIISHSARTGAVREANPIIVAVDVHNHTEQVIMPTKHSNQLESYC